MKKKIIACAASFAVAAAACVTAFAAPLYVIPSDKVSSGNMTLAGDDGIYYSASELSGLTYIKLTASTNSESPELLSGSFKVICDDDTRVFNWTVEDGDGVVFTYDEVSFMYEAVIEEVDIPSDSSTVELVFENDSDEKLNIVGIELGGVDEPKIPELEEPSSSDVSEEPSSVESSEPESSSESESSSEIESSSEPESSSEIVESSSQTETSSDSIQNETDNSNKPTGVGTGLTLAGIAIASAAVVSLKKSK